MKPVRIKSLKIGMDSSNDYTVTAEVEGHGGVVHVVHHTCLPDGTSWDSRYNDLIMTVLRECRDLTA